MRKFKRLTEEFKFIRGGNFNLSVENTLQYHLDNDHKGMILYAFVIHENENHFLRYVGRSSYGLRTCLDRIRTGSQGQATNHRLKNNIINCLRNKCIVSIYYLSIQDNNTKTADTIKNSIIRDNWRPDWNH
jgi:hypothetical protein